MTISSPFFKHLLLDLICFTDEVNEAGQRVPRTSWPKAIASSCSSLKSKLLNDVEKSEDGTSWLSSNDEKPEGFTPTRERFSTGDITLTDSEKSAIKYLYEKLEDVADYGAEAFELLDQLLCQ